MGKLLLSTTLEICIEGVDDLPKSKLNVSFVQCVLRIVIISLTDI